MRLYTPNYVIGSVVSHFFKFKNMFKTEVVECFVVKIKNYK